MSEGEAPAEPLFVERPKKLGGSLALLHVIVLHHLQIRLPTRASRWLRSCEDAPLAAAFEHFPRRLFRCPPRSLCRKC